MRQTTRPSPQRLRCPLCRDDLDAAPRSVCRGCQTSYHSACGRELGGCSTLGCSRMSTRPAPYRKERTVELPPWRREALRRQVREEETRRAQRRREDEGAAERVAEHERRTRTWSARSGQRGWANAIATVLFVVFYILLECESSYAWPVGGLALLFHIVAWLLDQGNPAPAVANKEESDTVTGVHVFGSTAIGFVAGALIGVGGYAFGSFPAEVSVWFAVGMGGLLFVGVGFIYLAQRAGEALGIRRIQ